MQTLFPVHRRSLDDMGARLKPCNLTSLILGMRPHSSGCKFKQRCQAKWFRQKLEKIHSQHSRHVASCSGTARQTIHLGNLCSATQRRCRTKKTQTKLKEFHSVLGQETSLATSEIKRFMTMTHESVNGANSSMGTP